MLIWASKITLVSIAQDLNLNKELCLQLTKNKLYSIISNLVLFTINFVSNNYLIQLFYKYIIYARKKIFINISIFTI